MGGRVGMGGLVVGGDGELAGFTEGVIGEWMLLFFFFLMFLCFFFFFSFWTIRLLFFLVVKTHQVRIKTSYIAIAHGIRKKPMTNQPNKKGERHKLENIGFREAHLLLIIWPNRSLADYFIPYTTVP